MIIKGLSVRSNYSPNPSSGGWCLAGMLRYTQHTTSPISDNVLYQILVGWYAVRMKRDPDLVRDILLAVEASDEIPMGWIDIEIEGRSQQEVAYHVQILDEAGLLTAQDLSSMSSYDWRPKRLTAAGHDFLDAVRDPKIWRSTKEGALGAGGWTLELLADLAKGFLRKQIERHTGVEL